MKIRKLIGKFLCSLIFLAILGCVQLGIPWVVELKCEHMYDPLGVSTRQPRFSWKNWSGIEGAQQTAYQLLVATSADALSEEKADLWNSGKVASSSNLLIEYQGEPLQTRGVLYWKVRVWDEEDNVSKWSKPATFSIGILEESDWEAFYIGHPSEDGFQQCPQFRKLFSVGKVKKGDSYLLHVNSLGYHEVFLNGQRVGDEVLSPAVSQFNKRSLINTYNVTPYLKSGDNDLVIWLGSGWYTEGLPGVVGDGPMVRAQLEKNSGQSTETVIVTNDTWQARNSEYRRISDWRSGRYGGEEVVGNLEATTLAFKEPGKVSWGSATVVEIPEHVVTPQRVEPNRIIEKIAPSTVERLNDSTYLVDMGTTLAGWFEIIFPPLKTGQQVVLEYADHLDENGELAHQGQVDHYIASGNGIELFKNRFNYHGFRYVKLSNLHESPSLANIKGYLIHTDFEHTSSFECSDIDLNRIHDMVKYTLRCLGLGGYLVDCPQIERLGYGGDGNASTVTAQTMFSLAPMYNNWLDAWMDVVREDGGMPHTAPNPYPAGGGPYWCGFIISASWHTYQHYGDIHVLEKYYPVMQQWLGYVEAHSVDGLLKRWPDTDYRGWYLGDWATPDGVGNPNHLDERSVDLVNNCYLSVCFSQMADIAAYLNREKDKARYLEMKRQLNAIIHDTFFDEETECYATGSQLDLIFPLLADVVPQSLRDNVVNTLIERTKREDNGHLNIGLVGIPVMMEWAAKNDQPEFIYSMLKKKTYPGYLYMLENGATTTWEHWNGARSRIHNCFNGVGQWFYQSVGGIRPIDGKVAYSEILIDPQIPSGVTWAKTRIKTPNGWVSLHWEVMDNRMTMSVEVPVGSIAKVKCPDTVTEVTVNQQPRSLSGELAGLELASGKYILEYVW